MAIIKQDQDNPVDNATGYVTEAEFTAYCDARGYDHSSYDSAAIEIAVLKGTEFLDMRFDYRGQRSTTTQNTEFPRTRYGIPTAVIHACCEYSFRALSADLVADPDNLVDGKRVKKKSEDIGGALKESIEFDYDGDYVIPSYPVADLKLERAGLVKPGNVGFLQRG